MSEKLLSYAAVLLLFSTFTYQVEDRFNAAAGVNRTLLFARIIPLMIVTLICGLSVPVRRYIELVKSFGKPPFLFFSWYVAVAATSATINRQVPTPWSVWKCTEIMIVVLWAAAVWDLVQRTGRTQVLTRIFSLLVVSCYAMILWSIGEIFRNGESISNYVLKGYRLDTEWPHINSITLSIMSLFAISGGVLLTNRMRLLPRVILATPPLIVFWLARSRTGILGLLVIVFFSLMTGTITKGKKVVLVGMCVCVFLALATNESVRSYMRVDSWEELARGAGRIRTEDGSRSGWGETVGLIKKSPAIGYGFVIVRRFLESDHAAVDNFVLQSLVTAGLIGAVPLIAYTLFAFLRWLVTKVASADLDAKRIAEMGLLATCLGFVKSFTTNGLSTFDISLIIFLFGAVTQAYVLSNATSLRSESNLPIHDGSYVAHLN